MKKLYYLSFVLVSSCLIIACSKNEPVADVLVAPNLPEQVYTYSELDLSLHPSLQGNDDYIIVDEVATLGRVLFYDTKLSATNGIACASCHAQQAGFSDLTRFSKGFRDQLTTRNAMSISNTIFMRGFFWDLRTRNLEALVLMPIQNHIEMGMEDLDILVNKLGEVDYYAPLFEAAFNTPEISKERISISVAQFLNSMVSLNAKYDQGLASNFSNFTQMEKIGMDLFRDKARCVNCHGEPTFDSRWGSIVANIGLDLEYEDPGMGDVGNPSSSKNGVFKIPSLRNIALTGPYMHDGRFSTLVEVVDHYNEGIQNHPSLDWRLRSFNQDTGESEPLQLNLDDFEKKALVSFLKTLTDEDYVNDVRFSNPFH